MREQMLALYALQKIDAQIASINSRLAAMDGAKSLKKAYVTAKASLQESETALQKQESELMDLELKLKAVDEKRVKFEQRLYSGVVTNPKELGSIEKEVTILKDQQGKLDTQVLALYDEVESVRSAAQQARKTLQDAEAAARQAISKENSEKKRLESELAELASQRSSAAVHVTDSALMARYDTVRRKTGNTGVARILDNRCEACHVAVTSFVTRKLFEDGEYVSCESCGRILMKAPSEADE